MTGGGGFLQAYNSCFKRSGNHNQVCPIPSSMWVSALPRVRCPGNNNPYPDYDLAGMLQHADQPLEIIWKLQLLRNL